MANVTSIANLPGQEERFSSSCSTFSLSGTPSLNYHFGANNKIVDGKTLIYPNFAYEVLRFGNFPWVKYNIRFPISYSYFNILSLSITSVIQALSL